MRQRHAVHARIKHHQRPRCSGLRSDVVSWQRSSSLDPAPVPRSAMLWLAGTGSAGRSEPNATTRCNGCLPPQLSIHRGYPDPSHVRQLIQAARHAGAAARSAGSSQRPACLPAPSSGPPGCGVAMGSFGAPSDACSAHQPAPAAAVRWMPAIFAPQSPLLCHRQQSRVRA